MQNNLNIDGLNTSSQPRQSSARRGYVWIDGTGEETNLTDPSSYMVLREGINGFSNSTTEYATQPNSNMMGEVLRQTNTAKREFGFRVLIIGTDHADIEAKRKRLLYVFSPSLGMGTLVKSFDDGSTVRISCLIAPGYPDIVDGLPMGSQARTQVVEVRFVAPDPYFYGDEVVVVGDANHTATVINNGDAIAQCMVKISGQLCRNLTTGEEMTAAQSKSINGLTVTVCDGKVVAADFNNHNAIGNFSHGSRFWMLATGENSLDGIQWIKFRPRWSSI